MVKVMYTVKDARGKVFQTPLYKEAHIGGNEIVEVNYKPIPEEYAEKAVAALIKQRREHRKGANI